MLFPYTQEFRPLLSSGLKTGSQFFSLIPVFLAGNNSVDETGAKVRGKETQRPCQGSHPVGTLPLWSVQAHLWSGVSLTLPGIYACSFQGPGESCLWV